MMSEAPRRRLPRWVSTLVVVGLAVLFLFPGPWRDVEDVASTALAPLQMGFSGTMDEAANFVSTITRVRDLADENAAYKDQIDQLQSQVVKMHELEVENADLRNLLSMRDRTGPGALVPVQVIARDDSPYVQAITIDHGAADGVKQDAVVITHQGLVGLVEKVDPTSSKVRLINDLNSSVSVRLQTEARTTGVLRGESQGNLMVIDYIPQTDVVSEGDVVLTSGLGGVYPEGLVVGKVDRIERKDADPFQSAVVQAAVEMDKLERLYVLANSGQ
ncbi:MAG: rod shape-determining protein MreC [Chloroflexi bacterium]|nr:rod shape-determining protein MreC [Chloroflexota bacterium]